MGHFQLCHSVCVLKTKYAGHTFDIFEHIWFLDQFLELVNAENLALTRFVILGGLVEPLDEQFENLELLDEGFRVAFDVDLFYDAAFAGHGALAEEDLALG